MLMTVNWFSRILAVFGIAVMAVTPAWAAKDALHTSTFNNLGAGGYDPVAYFTQGKAIKGHEDLSVEWSGVKWRFSSQDSLDRFLAAPESYVPQYGGYDPLSVAEGKLVGGKPKIWTVIDNKLYLHQSRDSRDFWRVERRNWIAQADANWPQILESGGGFSLPSFKIPWFGKDK